MNKLHNITESYSGYGGKSYITFSVPAAEEIVQYQTEMLAKNPGDFLLPLSVQRINDNWKLSYEITSKIPLVKVLERKSLKYEEFENIIKQIGKLTMKLRDYLLDISSVVFDKSYIYCDPGDLSLYFIYLPVKCSKFDSTIMKDFLQKLIFEDIRLQDDSSASLLKKLLDVLKSETFTPEQLLKCINSKQAENKLYISEKSNESCEADKVFNDFRNAARSGQFARKHEEPVPRGKTNYHESITQKTEKSSKITELKYPLKSYLIAGVINIFLLAALVYILFSGSSSKNITSTLLGLVLIGFAADYFVITRLFSGEKNTADGEKTVKSTVVKRFVNEAIEEDIILPKRTPVHTKVRSYSDIKAGNDSMDFEPVKSDCNNHYEPAEIVESDISVNGITETNAFAAENKIKPDNDRVIHDRTVILGVAQANVPYLQSHSCPTERINITKDSMLLGRLTGSVDYTIHNKAVGKIHAEIIKKENNYYIIDLNSVNGTYVNHKRITCSTEVKLNNGDIVTIANESYTFVI